MKIKLSPYVIKELAKIKRKDHNLEKTIQNKLLLFTHNPKHHSLRIHKLTGRQNQIWNMSINMKIRILYQLRDDGTAYFVDIGTHEEVYKK